MHFKSIGIVYFVHAPAVERVKIGFSYKDPAVRVRELRIGSPVELLLLGCHRGSRAFEGQLHERFWADRAHGEWFHARAEMMAYIRANARPYDQVVAERKSAMAVHNWARHREIFSHGIKLPVAQWATGLGIPYLDAVDRDKRRELINEIRETLSERIHRSRPLPKSFGMSDYD